MEANVSSLIVSMLLLFSVFPYCACIQECFGNDCLDLPERCDDPYKCTDRELYEMCFYNVTWHKNKFSDCHHILKWDQTYHFDSARSLLARMVKDQDEQDMTLALMCTIDDDFKLSKLCKKFESYRHKRRQTHREATIAHYLANMEIFLAEAEHCEVDPSWKPDSVGKSCSAVTSMNARERNQAETRLAIAIEGVSERNKKDMQLVAHCFKYHQFVPFDDCKGITTDEPIPWTKSDFRVKAIKTRYAELADSVMFCSNNMERNDHFGEYCRKEYPSDKPDLFRHVLKCLYSKAWQSDEEDRCHLMVHGNKNGKLDQREQVLLEQQRQLYQAELKRIKERDCRENHINDSNYPDCKTVTQLKTIKVHS